MDGLGQISSGGALFKPEKETTFIWRALTSTGAIFALSFLVYLGLLLGYKPLIGRSINEVNAEIDKISNASIKDLESEEAGAREFLDFYSQTINIQELLKNHVAITPVFDLIERNTRGDVVYQSIQIDAETGVISLSGTAKDYTSLSSQLAVYNGLPQVLSTTITGSRQSDVGMVFDFKMTINPSVFEFAPVEVNDKEKTGEKIDL